MPSARYTATLTGLSTTSRVLNYFPDTAVRPFDLSVSAVVNSTGISYSVQHSLDYSGSSTFISSNATWFTSSGISAATSNAFTAYNYPVTALQLTATSGSSTSTITWTVVQAG